MTDPSQYFRGRTVQEQMNEVIGYVDVRSAEVATDAIASDVAQVHSDAADAHADALAAAASAAAAAGTLTNAVKKTGEASQSIDGDVDINDDLNVDGDATVGGALSVTGAVTVPTPVNNTDAANKKYVDDADALKISITDVNSYAVGLTGNQNPIVGEKTFTSKLKRLSVLYNNTIEHKITNMTVSDIPGTGTFLTIPSISVIDSNDVNLFSITYTRSTTYTALNIRVDDSQSRSTTVSIRANEDGTSAIYLIGPNGTRQVALI